MNKYNRNLFINVRKYALLTSSIVLLQVSNAVGLARDKYHILATFIPISDRPR